MKKSLPYASYRFRLHDAVQQASVHLPSYLSKCRISDFYLRNELPNCVHHVRVMVHDSRTLAFEVAGLAGYNHGAAERSLASAVRRTAGEIFGTPASVDIPAFCNDLDRFDIPLSGDAGSLPALIQEYVRRLSEDFPITRGRIGYVPARLLPKSAHT